MKKSRMATDRKDCYCSRHFLRGVVSDLIIYLFPVLNLLRSGKKGKVYQFGRISSRSIHLVLIMFISYCGHFTPQYVFLGLFIFRFDSLPTESNLGSVMNFYPQILPTNHCITFFTSWSIIFTSYIGNKKENKNHL